ncbi:MAG TPA: hypothetical protein VJG32_05340 [Anaerolineae bacterium]|nr:hypothetical protein [Anaerolineae bacterium]
MNKRRALLALCLPSGESSRTHRIFPGLIRILQQLTFPLLLIVLSACAPQGSSIPLPTSPPGSEPTLPVATAISRASTPNLPTSIPSPTVSSLPDLPPPRPGWTWYQSQYAGYRIAYPQSWIQQKEWGQNTRPDTSRERVRFYSLNNDPEVIVDLWDMASLKGLDLLAWINSNPEGILFAKLAQPVSYNATIVGWPAVFQYQPAAWGSGDLVALIFSDGKYVFRIFLNGTAIPPREADASVYRAMLETFALPDGSVGALSLPTGWEKGAGLVVSRNPRPSLANLSVNELRHYRQGLTGTVDKWIEELVHGGVFSIAREDGQEQTVRIEPFHVAFRGTPIDYEYQLPEPPKAGNRVRVAGSLTASGEILAEYIGVEQGSAWQTWFHKTLFDITADEFDPTLLANYRNDQDNGVWLQGSLQDVMTLLVDAHGKPLSTDHYSTHLKQTGLAFGKLTGQGNFRVEVQALYGLGEELALGADQEHWPAWQQLYPPLPASTITATVSVSEPQARVMVLHEPVEGFVTVTLAPEGKLLHENGNLAEWSEVTSGIQIRATGKVSEGGSLLAQQVFLASAPYSP